MSEQSFEMIAKTFQGLEETLAQELTSLGANEIQIGRRMVSFCGDKEMMYKANFCLRTAIRILKPTLEALFTATEETGMDGAFGLKKGVLHGDILLNLDRKSTRLNSSH